ncbi:MAG: class I SAM-dependent methyltransferase [Cyanobacteria bacterium P01_F01_bin.53]
MSVFANYARYYDLLYQDKDYIGEVKFIHDLIAAHAPNSKTLVDFGCGTGSHDIYLAKEGYDLHGVDLSAEMLANAKERSSHLPEDLSLRLTFSQGDIRTARLEKAFDVVLSLFHVMSYQVTNEDLLAAFKTAKSHLKPGGVFIFDVWYGPAVLSDPPVVRVKRLEDNHIQVTRVAEPVLYPNENMVDVNYQVFIRDKASAAVEEVKETHKMRYIFKSEVEYLLQQLDMKLLHTCAWMSDAAPDATSWNACFVVRG